MKEVLEMTKQKITIIGNVYETYDYGMFKTLEGNRNTKERDVKKLAISISKKYNVCPIILTSDYYVIDGQHRLLACKLLGLPVRYVIDKNATIDDISRLNSYSKKWTQIDYLLSYKKQGIEDYIVFHRFMMEHNITINVGLLLFASDGGSSSIPFKEGLFSSEKLEEATWLIEKFKKITKFNPKINFRFLRVIKTLLKNSDFDIDIFINKLSIQPTKLVNCATAPQYRMLIEGIYNYKSRKKINLRY